jgi:hypothetical protein
MYRKYLHGMVITLFILTSTFSAPVVSAGAITSREASVQNSLTLGKTNGLTMAPNAPNDVPVTLVGSGVTLYTIADPKVFWYTGVPICPPAGPNAPTAYTETIQRIPTYGGLTRTLYSHSTNCSGDDPVSNIISDGSNLYWMSASMGGVVKLSTDANPGDSPTLLSSTVSGYSELTQAGDTLYILINTGAASNASLWSLSKSGGTATELLPNAGPYASNLRSDGAYVFWLTNGNLEQWDIHYASSNGTIDSGVTGYTPALQVDFYAKGRTLMMYSNLDNTYTPLYTSSDTSAVIYSIAYDGPNLYFFEDRTLSCAPQPCFPPHEVVLFRAGSDGSNPTDIYLDTSGNYENDKDLIADGDFLFWQQGSSILRLPKNASALPMINMYGSSLEVSQGIQDLNNSVQLIENRRTFVRFYVFSGGNPVPGVTAYLYRLNNVGAIIDGPLTPVNPVGQQITVKPWANRMEINDSFLFELPWNWLTGTLRLRAVLNPNQVPLEPNYSDNTVNAGPFTFVASPRLSVQFVAFGYSIGNQTYYPRFIQDILQTYSWVRRAYPLASTPGFWGDPTPGFRPNLWFVYDDGLGSRVNQTAPGCTDNLCASAYTNNLLNALRAENGVPGDIFMYGMISDASGIFPRGQASGNVSSGPAGSGNWGWDYDGSYADWYAGHEIGHTLGRAHPTPSAIPCGNSASDDNYPYFSGQIGNGLGEGLDVGDPGLNPLLKVAIYPSFFWHDVMTYCNNQWISDYTYNAMYSFMMAHPTMPTQSGNNMATPQAPRTSGNFLSVFGSIFPGKDSATIDHIAHVSSVASIPPITPGLYSIRLVGSGGTLHDYLFTPTNVEETTYPTLSYGQVVNYIAGTTKVEIVRMADNKILASKNIPAHSPTINNVALQGAPNPVSGTVTLGWNASDADGLPLTFDVYYSADNGVTFQPFKLGVKTSSTAIDTSNLGGSSTAILRVIASDGVNTASADSAAFTMANKPPIVVITNPGDNTHVHYGQLVNFSGEAFDLQDGSVSGTGLVWSNQFGTLGTGATLSSSNLPVGENDITLTATNSKGLSGHANIKVFVDDNLNHPGPDLTAAPGSVAWQVAPGTTTHQTAKVLIDNAGGGITNNSDAINWTVGATPSWLSVDKISGTTPYTITLTANPTGLTNGKVVTATLEIHAPQVSQTVSVPVILTIGNTWFTHTGPNNPKYIYLPLLSH